MLILRLQTPDDQEFTYTALGSNALSSEWSRGGWADALKVAGGQPVVLLVPTRDVLLTHTLLPTTNTRQLKQALPYALEESLVGEPEEQHFVWQARHGGDELDVAVIERSRLKQWMATLRQHKLRAKAILPDVFALPWSDNMPTIWQRNGQVWVRHSATAGFSCPAESLPLLLDTLFEDEDQTRAVHLYTDSTAPWQEGLQTTPDRNPNMLLQRSIQDGMGLNLLAGYQDESMSSFNRNWKRWRAVGVVGLLALAIGVGTEALETSRLAKELELAQQRNLELFGQVFPEVGGITANDIRSRVKSEIKRMEGEGGGGDAKASPLPFMSKVAQVLRQEPSLKVAEIRTRSGKLTIVFEAPDLQVLAKVEEGLNAAFGRAVDIKSTQANNVVRAELTLEVS